jgi:hypothetical protein
MVDGINEPRDRLAADGRVGDPNEEFGVRIGDGEMATAPIAIVFSCLRPSPRSGRRRASAQVWVRAAGSDT